MGILLENIRKNKRTRNYNEMNFNIIKTHKSDIISAIDEGYSAKSIYDQMVQDGITNMCFSTFRQKLKIILKEKK